MLEKTGFLQLNVTMGRAAKRTRITAKKEAPSQITIRQIFPVKDGKTYPAFLVQGWKENDRWQRKQFKSRGDAERFAALKRVEMENQGRKLQMTLTPLTEDQTQQATRAFDALGETYTLDEVVDFFLRNHRPPEFEITVLEGIKEYLEDKQRDGLRARTIRGTKGVLTSFAHHNDDPKVHKVTRPMVESYLRALRAADRVSPAKRKSWNTHRNEISQFFSWAMKDDLSTNRPWCFTNPVDGIRIFSARQIAEQRPAKATTPPEQLCRMFSTLMRFHSGKMVKFFALSYFAGIRPEGELEKLAERENELINLKTRKIFVPAAISKTKSDRQITISENLLAWLNAYRSFPIIPVNFKMLQWKIRTHFALKRDETRHSFISYFVALNRSVGDAALQAGNSESMVRQHYLNLHTQEEGKEFFSISPDLKARRASII